MNKNKDKKEEYKEINTNKQTNFLYKERKVIK